MKNQTPTTLLKRITGLLVILFVISGMFGVTFPQIFSVSAASAPNIVTYQGRLLNSSGVPVSDTSLSLKFELYDASSGGTCVWSNSSATCDGNTPASTTARTVTLTDGLFSENLGDTGASTPYAAIADTVFGDNAGIYLQVYVAGETLTPRKQMTAVPYAINADTVDGLDSTVFNLWTDAGTETYLTSATDDFVIGGTAITTSPFAVDESANTIYIGEGSNSDGTITFKASDGDTGDISYSTDDAFFITGGDVNVNGLTAWPSAPGSSSGMIHVTGTFDTAASGGAGIYEVIGIKTDIYNNDAEALGVSHDLTGISSKAENSTDGEVANLYGVSAIAKNNGTTANAVGTKLVGVSAWAIHDGAGVTVPEAYGTFSHVSPDDGVITSAYGILAQVDTGSGTVTTSYAGDFLSTQEGTTRYGIRATASGGTTNYAGYFYGGQVFIDSTSTPSTPSVLDGAGDLYIYDQLEIDGTNQTDGTVIDLDNLTLTTGKGLSIRRMQDAVTDFTNIGTGLVDFEIQDVLSNGNLLYLNHSGVGSSLYIDQVGDNIALKVNGTATTDYLATFANDGNADTNMGISIQGCLDVNPTTDCNFLVFKDGDGGVLGAVEGNSAGGVTNASAGSDYAELFNGTYADFSVGDIIAINAFGSAIVATDASNLIGAFSIAPNTLGNWFDGWQSMGNYVPVALLGQVPVNVNDSGGAITIGDYITLSSSAGVGRKATGVGYVVGQALENHTTGTGTIEVLVNPRWVAVDVLTEDGSALAINQNMRLNADGTATASTTGVNSKEFVIRGSGWNGSSADNLDMSLITTVSDGSTYGLSIKNDDSTEVAYVSQDGDLAIAGRLYPSDRGVLQTDKYIYYDGSSGAGGDFMRTNASGWGAGSYDFAEMFPAIEPLSAGEVVVFANDEESVGRSTGKTYDNKIAGVVSTQPGFLAGENIKGHVPIALAGRVPTYVSGENGDISIGDPITTSTKGGYAMKATEAGPIVGYAMEAFSGNTGVITAFIRPSYYNGRSVTDTPGAENTASGFTSVSKLDLSGTVNLNGGSIVSVGSLAGIGNNWIIDEEGNLTTKGQFVHLVDSYQGELVETYAALSRNITIQLTGSVELKNGSANIKFEDVDPLFNDVISNIQPYKVFLTANAPTNSLYALNRNSLGFQIKEIDGKSNVIVDWLVIAYHKDFEPEEVVPANEEVVEEEIVEPAGEIMAEDTTTDADDEIVIEEPDTVEEVEVVQEQLAEETIIESVEDIVTEESPVVEEAIESADEMVESNSDVTEDDSVVETEVSQATEISESESTDIVIPQ